MKTIILIIATLLMVVPVSAQTMGVDFGMLISKGSQPSPGYAIISQFSIDPLGGQIFKTVQVSVLYSDYNIAPVNEVYAVRSFAGRQFQYKAAYAGVAVGGYVFANTQGSDFTATAAQVTMGFRLTGFDIHIGGDIISRKGDDIFYPYGGIKIGL
jgi:hypothetical protein